MVFLMAGFEMNPAVLRGRPIRNALFGWVVTSVIAFGAAMLLNITGLASAHADRPRPDHHRDRHAAADAA